MDQSDDLRGASGRQFTLRSLFELTTICCVLAALTPSLGLGGTMSLMLLAITLQFRLGGLSLAAFMAAALTVPLRASNNRDTSMATYIAVSLAAAAVCGWYWWRSGAASESAQKNPEQPARG